MSDIQLPRSHIKRGKIVSEGKLSHYLSIAQTTMSNTKKVITIVMMVCLNLKFTQGEGGPSVTLNTTDLMNIFIPQGDLIGQTNFATLRASMNITNLFIESREVCTITALMKESLNKILKNNHSLSSSNRTSETRHA